jgi:hypothetical protein
MSKLAEIERALLAIDPADFQRLCDAYLRARGYQHINPIGLVVGASKVKRGTPDTLITLPNGNYVFAEYTTQQSGVAEKLLGDMRKCFDDAKTGIPVERIQEFLACHTSVLTPKEEHELVDEGRRRGCLVTLFGLGPLSHDLFNRFPGLARDFLSVELDTGQIITLNEFVSAYGKSAVATPLDTVIRFRDEDIERGLAGLHAGDVLIVAGPPGVGKSRLALEVCRRFVNLQPEFTVRSVLYHGLDLFADVRTYFAAPGAHLIFVDDANRVSGFEHILRLLHEQRDDRRIKIVATVRDYALPTIRERVAPYGPPTVVTLAPLSEEQIREILSKDFGIGNYRYQERIGEISRGNPRLAVMAARVAVREQRFESIANVSVLYDEYFGSIRKDLVELQDAELLRAAGILASFRNVDRKNNQQMKLIADAFQISGDRLWNAVTRLHDLELVDLYEDEVARIADQVLATYLFHLSFFRERVLNPAGFLHSALFPSHRSRLFDALNPALTAFDAEDITNTLRPLIKQRWEELNRAGDDETLFELVNAFGAIDETATLTFLRDRVAALEEIPVDLATITFKPATSSDHELLGIVGSLRNNDLTIVRIALTLALDIVAKDPNAVPAALDLLMQRFGISHLSYLRDYEVERAAVEGVWERAKLTTGVLKEVFTRLFLIVAQPMVKTHFQSHESRGARTITIYRFDVPATPPLKELRRIVWEHVGELLHDPAQRALAVSFVRAHASIGHEVRSSELIGSDSAVVLPLLAQTLDPLNFAHCVAVQGYLQLLKRHDVQLDVDLESQRVALQSRFTSSTYQLAALILDDFYGLLERQAIGWLEYEAQKSERLASFVSSYDVADFDRLISELTVVRRDVQGEQSASGTTGPNRDDWQLREGAASIFQSVAARDPVLFCELIDRYLEQGDPLELEPHRIVPLVFASTDVDRTHAILTQHKFARRGLWLTGFFVWLPEEAVTREHFESLCAHFDHAGPYDLFRDVDFVVKYERVDSNAVLTVTEILVRRAQSDTLFGSVVADTFDKRGAIGGRLQEIFGNSASAIALLKRAYMAADLGGQHFDYDASAFSVLLDLDPEFGREWIDWKYEQSTAKGWLSRHDDHRDYSSLWLREDFVRVMRSILEAVRRRDGSHHSLWSYANVFMRAGEANSKSATIRERQDEFLREWVVERTQDAQEMAFVFSLVAEREPARRRSLLAAFLARNQQYEDFRRLSLEASSWGWSGSAVPMLAERVEFFQSLLPLFDKIELLDHRRQVEDVIRRLRSEIEVEKKRDFLDA